MCFETFDRLLAAESSDCISLRSLPRNRRNFGICLSSLNLRFLIDRNSAEMSGISFKITAPARPNSGASSAPPSRPQSRSTSRHHPHHNEASEEDSDDDDAFRRASGRDNKRRRVGEEEVVEFGKDGATR